MEPTVKHYITEIKLGLEKISALRSIVGRPDEALKIIHVAGTNGKGSVCQMLSYILQEAGYKVGSFNSPHLVHQEECIKINGIEITKALLTQYVERLEKIAHTQLEAGLFPSPFEQLTTAALMYFKDQKVDFVLLEVGLGGALDATNVINQSLVSVITKIGIDHTDFLGDTLGAITKQKAGIIKPKGKVITPIQAEEVNEVIEAVCQSQDASIKWVDSELLEGVRIAHQGTYFTFKGEAYQLRLIGAHQAYNAAIALTVIEVLQGLGEVQMTQAQIKAGIAKATWQGRFERISEEPLVYIDGAHNTDGITALASTLAALEKRHTIGLIGVLADKAVDELLAVIAPHIEEWIVTEPDNPRALSKEQLYEKIRSYSDKVQVAESIEDGIRRAVLQSQKQSNSQIIAFGSLYMIGKVRRYTY